MSIRILFAYNLMDKIIWKMQINLTSYLFTDCFRDVLMCDSFIQINRVFNNKTECIIILDKSFGFKKDSE